MAIGTPERIRRALPAAAFAVMACFCSCSYSFTWVKDVPIKEAALDDIMDEAQEAFHRQDYERAAHLAAFVSEYFPDSPEVEEALYVAGESCFLLEDYWKSFQYFKEIPIRYRTSRYIDHVAQRYYEIGEAFLNREPGFFGHLFTGRGRGVKVMNHLVTYFRQIDVADDARIAVADYYFEEREYVDAAYYYKQLIIDYPRSEWVEKAIYRMGMSYLNSSKGSSYDRETLIKGLITMQKYLERYPSGQYQEPAKDMEAFAKDQLARKELEIGLFYLNQDRDFGARLHLANAVLLFSDTEAGRQAQTLLNENGWDTSLNSWRAIASRESMKFLR